MPKFKLTNVDYFLIALALVAIPLQVIFLHIPFLIATIFSALALLVEQVVTFTAIGLAYKFGFYEVPTHPDDLIPWTPKFSKEEQDHMDLLAKEIGPKIEAAIAKKKGSN